MEKYVILSIAEEKEEEKAEVVVPSKTWWKEAVVYQINPKSFKEYL